MLPSNKSLFYIKQSTGELLIMPVISIFKKTITLKI